MQVIEKNNAGCRKESKSRLEKEIFLSWQLTQNIKNTKILLRLLLTRTSCRQLVVEHVLRWEEKNQNGKKWDKKKNQVTVNGTSVHSKLATMAFPDYEATAQVQLWPEWSWVSFCFRWWPRLQLEGNQSRWPSIRRADPGAQSSRSLVAPQCLLVVYLVKTWTARS